MLDESIRGADLTVASKTARDVRYALPDADLHPLGYATGDLHIDHLRNLAAIEPGSAEFNQRNLVGSMAPEEVIEVMGPEGAEGIGIIKLLDKNGNPT